MKIVDTHIDSRNVGPCKGDGPRGHGEAAGGQIPLTGKSKENHEGVVPGLFEDFLRLLGRDGCHPRPLVPREGYGPPG